MAFFDKLKAGLTNTRTAIKEQIDNIFTAFKTVDEELYEELEEALITADVGAQTSVEIIDMLRDAVDEKRITESEDVKKELYEIISDILSENDSGLKLDTKPSVILVVGVNGVGKTTSIGKLAHRLISSGKSVMLAAGDTFRAAASEQLAIWAERCNCPIVKHSEGADPAAVIFDAIVSAKAKNTDVLICDTAGRLHNKKNLMEELRKINKILEKEYADAFRETLVVLDATTGQNALEQARQFSEIADITGIILTKMDGTAKGGIAVAIQSELGIPVKYIGVGESIDDLQKFDSEEFVNALFEVKKEA